MFKSSDTNGAITAKPLALLSLPSSPSFMSLPRFIVLWGSTLYVVNKQGGVKQEASPRAICLRGIKSVEVKVVNQFRKLRLN